MNSPEVRQCRDQADEQFGAVAVKAAPDRWGVMNPGVVNPNRVGGHWTDDKEVAGWVVLSARTQVAKPVAPAPVPVAASTSQEETTA